jgi:hypothetical protein
VENHAPFVIDVVFWTVGLLLGEQALKDDA